jgi:N-acetylglucosaminylphosphatidylinositol deacetylase
MQIITFDEDGISGHGNHRAINAALVKAANVDLSFPTVFTLRTSRSILGKYTSVFSYPFLRAAHRWRASHPLPKITWDPDIHPIAAQKHAFLPSHPVFTKDQMRNGYLHPFSSHSSLLVNSPWQYLKSRSAFKQHKSQNVWFRKLYMLASRYMWFNELHKVVRIHERIVDVGKVREAAKGGL